MIFTLKDIETFSRCPRQFHLARETPEKIQTITKSKNHILEEVMLITYRVYLETGKIATWAYIRSRILRNKDIRKKKVQYDLERQLNGANDWYTYTFLQQPVETYYGLEIPLHIGNHTITTKIPFITPTEIPTITSIQDNETPIVDIQYGFIPRAQAVIVANSLRCKDVRINYLYINGGGILRETNSIIEYTKNARMYFYLKQMLQNISSGSSYPSISTQCNDCSFKSKCRL